MGADYLHHFQMFDGLVPFVGAGLSYTETTVYAGGASVDLDDFYWNLYLGLEFAISDQLLLPKIKIHSGFDDVTEEGTSVEASLALTYWINDVHGVSLSYTNNYLGDLDYFGFSIFTPGSKFFSIQP